MTTMQSLLHSMMTDLAGEIDLLWKATLLLVIASAVMGGLRWRSAAGRHLVWSLTMISLLLLPVLVFVLPRLPILPSPAALQVVGIAPQSSGPVAQRTLAHPGHAAAEGILLLWLTGLLVMLARIVAGTIAIRRLGMMEIADATLHRQLQSVASQLKIARKVKLHLSADRVMPMTWGTLHPRILLPANAVDWPAHRTRLVLLHELAHVRRLDCLTHLLASIARAMFWFHPLVWFAAAQMKMEREKACDDLVLQQGERPSVYADELLMLSTQFNQITGFGAAIAIARSNRLQSRVSSILQENHDRKSLSTRSLTLPVIVACTAVPGLAMLSQTPQKKPNGVVSTSTSFSINQEIRSAVAPTPVLVEDDSMAEIRQQMRSVQNGVRDGQQIAPPQQPDNSRPGMQIDWGDRPHIYPPGWR